MHPAGGLPYAHADQWWQGPPGGPPQSPPGGSSCSRHVITVHGGRVSCRHPPNGSPGWLWCWPRRMDWPC